MTAVCLYFKVHQPHRLKKYQPTDVGLIHSYEDDNLDKLSMDIAADNCYLPANKILLDLIHKYKNQFRVSFSISGTMLELAERYRPDVIASFKELVATGAVEILGETYYHSLSFLHSKREFQRQIEMHAAIIKRVFSVETPVFRNTELIYNNDLSLLIAGMGYKGILCEGIERILQGRTSNKLYAAPGNGDFPLLLRNANLSDDIAFRFDDSNWSEHPLTADKFAGWLHGHPTDTELVNLFMDYETFGIHKKEESGVFNFLAALPGAVLADPRFRFSTPASIISDLYPRDIYHVPETIAWEDRSDLKGVWSRNMMQNNMLKKIYSVEKMVINSESPDLIDTWGRLQAADHFYYMADEEGEEQKYSNPFPTGETAYRNYHDILVDFEISLIKNSINLSKKNSRNTMPAFNLY